MSLAIAGKILGGVLVTAGSCVGAYFIYDALKNDDVSFLTTSKLVSETHSDNLFNGNVKQYKCKSSAKEFNCTIYKFNTTATHTNITQIMNADKAIENTQKNALKKASEIYKVIVNKVDGDETFDWKTIEKFDVVSTTNSNKFADLEVNVMMVGSTIVSKNKTKYFVFVGESEKTITSATEYKCLTKGTDAISESGCKIYSFGNEGQDNKKQGLEKWNFKKSVSVSNSIVADKYYLIEWDGVEKQTESKIDKINIKKSGDSNVLGHDYYVSAASMFGSTGSEKLFIWDY